MSDEPDPEQDHTYATVPEANLNQFYMTTEAAPVGGDNSGYMQTAPVDAANGSYLAVDQSTAGPTYDTAGAGDGSYLAVDSGAPAGTAYLDTAPSRDDDLEI